MEDYSLLYLKLKHKSAYLLHLNNRILLGSASFLFFSAQVVVVAVLQCWSTKECKSRKGLCTWVGFFFQCKISFFFPCCLLTASTSISVSILEYNCMYTHKLGLREEKADRAMEFNTSIFHLLASSGLREGEQNKAISPTCKLSGYTYIIKLNLRTLTIFCMFRCSKFLSVSNAAWKIHTFFF